MISCYFINMSSSSGRRILFQSRADDLGISVIRVDACDGNQLTEADLKTYRSRVRLEPWMSAGEIGCFLSHRKAWRLVTETGDQWAFVAEDDLYLADDCSTFFSREDWIPGNADLIKADTNFRTCHRSAEQETIAQMRFVRRLLSNHGHAGGYFISSSTAELLLELTNQMCEPADCILFNPDWGIFEKLISYQIEPAIGVQRQFFRATIQGVERSILDDDRTARPTRPRLMKRIRRELARPFRQMIHTLKNQQHSVRNGTLYSAVPFCKNPRTGPIYRSKRSVANLRVD